MVRISAAIICFNEEPNIRECLKSVSWCDEIVVVDSGSTDRTVEIAREFTDRVHHRPWPGYVEQVRFAMEQTTGEWIFCLDADERCTSELREELLREIPNAASLAGFEVPRHVEYLGRWIRHGGWYPDWKLRIVRRGHARCEGREPHYGLKPEGPTRRLRAVLDHRPYRNFREQLAKVNDFSDIFRDRWRKEHRRFSLPLALAHPLVKFFECYVWKLGFLDGWPGFAIATTSAFYVFAKYVKLREPGP